MRGWSALPRHGFVGFRVGRFQNDEFWLDAIHTITNEIEGQIGCGPKARIMRWPNHLNPVKREHALAIRFLEISIGEDRDYAKRLRPLLKTEEFMDARLYNYLLRSNEQREGERVHPSTGRVL